MRAQGLRCWAEPIKTRTPSNAIKPCGLCQFMSASASGVALRGHWSVRANGQALLNGRFAQKTPWTGYSKTFSARWGVEKCAGEARTGQARSDA